MFSNRYFVSAINYAIIMLLCITQTTFMQRVKYWLFLSLFCAIIPTYASIIEHFDVVKSDPKALYAFFKSMPKGGELHYHLAGGASAEIMIALATRNNYCIDPNTFTVSEPTSSCNLNIAEATKNKTFYNKILRAWTMQNFIPKQMSAHDHFFASFFKFMPLVADFQAQLLASVMQHAADQNELYLEVMILPDNGQSANFASLGNGMSLLHNKKFQQNIKHTITESRQLIHNARKIIGCDSSPTLAACNITIKFQYIVLREQPLDRLFAQALNGFAAASQSTDLIGVNLVQAEDGPISTRDYREQMRIFERLHNRYPQVHIALHAGEITSDLVPHSELRYHIRDAIFTGHAERIGHGVDITSEQNVNNLVAYMAKKPIPVEINLTSNHAILNVSGRKHPLRYYLANHVPVVLSTDDEGILRTDLTTQYVKAVTEHHLDYPTIKAINRNALTYSFLPGKSLWENNVNQTPVPECTNLFSKHCKQFISINLKAKLQWELENKLVQFERRWN